MSIILIGLLCWVILIALGLSRPPAPDAVPRPVLTLTPLGGDRQEVRLEGRQIGVVERRGADWVALDAAGIERGRSPRPEVAAAKLVVG